eukprot:12103925-Ditylum_brightwellii.AAC.1
MGDKTIGAGNGARRCSERGLKDGPKDGFKGESNQAVHISACTLLVVRDGGVAVCFNGVMAFRVRCRHQYQ